MAHERRRGKGGELAEVLERNIHALLVRRQAEQMQIGWQTRLAAAITRFTGSMRSVFLHLAFFGSWILINLGWLPVLPKFDPTFVVLAMVASVEAIFLSTFILISQNRIIELDARRADLDLQIGLLAEHEVTRLVALVTEMAKRMGIEEARNPELSQLAQDVHPEEVLQTIEEKEKELSGQE